MSIVNILRHIIEPGFFGSGPVHIALAVGTVVAVTSAVTGVFTVTRGQSFAGHSLADIATTGGSGAFLIGINQFWGYLAFGAGAAAFMEMIGIQRRRGRDVATGVVLGAALGLAALFLYLGTQYSTTTGASFTILFGSIFVITPSTVPALIVSALLALGTVIALARVLLLSSLSPDLAAARGVPVRAVGAAFLMALAVSVALSAVVIGAVLSTALLIGPAATALRVTKGPVRAAAVAAAIGVAATWLGILLAYDSYYWPPAGRGWPVSFFVVTLVVGGYLVGKIGLFRTMLIGVVASAISHLLFAWLSTRVGAPIEALIIAISCDNFAGSFCGTALIAYMSGLTGAGFSATPFGSSSHRRRPTGSASSSACKRRSAHVSARVCISTSRHRGIGSRSGRFCSGAPEAAARARRRTRR